MAIISSVLSLFFSNFAIILIVTIGIILYLAQKNNDYFEKRGIKFHQPLPIFGNMFRAFMRITPMSDLYCELYNKFPKENVIGIFEFVKPTFMIRDTEMIKQISIKNFENFMNHRQSINHEADPIFGRSLFMIRDQRWKDMRTILSPAFTGSKMRYMYDLIRDCAKSACEYIDKTSGGKPYEFEAKDLFTRLANDVIATSAFGIEVNSLKERENRFYKNGKVLTDFNALLALKFFIALNWPALLNTLRIPILDKDTSYYFKDIVLDTMNHREKNGIVRPDMIQLLLQTKAKLKTNNDEDQIQWTDDDFVAQSVLFFLAGFETTATLFSFMAYELALNVDIQDKLIQEIDDVASNLEGDNQPSYEDINKMKYLDMVVQESLRKWPPAILTDRLCNKTTTLTAADGTELVVQPGDSIEMPVFAMHRDPRFYPNPDKFDPERFSDENKDNINQFAFMPFGLGPRQCIGNRFALLEAKIIFYYILKNFRIATTAKTEIPLQMKMGVFNNISKNGIWLQLKHRN